MGGSKFSRLQIKKEDLCTIATQQMAKMKLKKAVLDRKKERMRKKSLLRGLHSRHLSLMTSKPKPKPALDHRKYGVWYMDPEDWEKRFHQNTKKPTLQQCIHKWESRHPPEKLLILKKKAAKARELSEKLDSDMKRSEKEATNDKEPDTSIQSPEMDDEEISQVQSKNCTRVLITSIYLLGKYFICPFHAI